MRFSVCCLVNNHKIDTQNKCYKKKKKKKIEETLRADYLNEVYVNRCLGLSCGLDVVSINNG